MSIRKIHPKWKIIRQRDGVIDRIRITPKDCPACKQKCATCGEPFSVSTADNEKRYCGRYCEGSDY